MATLQKLRNMGPMLVIFVGLALFAFIAGDAWRIFQPHQGTQSVGTINGEDISAADFQKMYEEYTNIMKFVRNNSSLSEQELAQAKDEVWNSYIRTKLIQNEAEKIGLTFTDAELMSIVNEGTHPILQQTPFFNQQTGKFDADMLNNFLAQYEMNKEDADFVQQYQPIYDYWKFIERTIAESAMAEKYQALISNSIISNPVAAKNAYEANNTTYDIEIKAIPYSSIADSTVEVSQSDIKKLYNQQKEQYRQLAESRDIKYVSYRVTPDAQDRAALKEEMNEYADSLRSNNADYEALARISYSEVPYSKIGWAKDVYPEEVQVRLDSVSANQVVGPIYNQSDDSYTTFKYLSNETIADSIRYRMLVVAAEDETKTNALTDSLMNVLKGGADFKEIASKYGQNGEETWLTSAQYEGMKVDGSNIDFLNTLFGAETGKYAIMNLTGTNNKVIYMVSEKKNLETKYHVAVIKRTSQFSSDTYKEAYNKFSQFVASCQNADDLSNKAEEFGFRVLEQNNIFTYAHNVANVAETRDALRWIFSEAGVGDISPLYECGNNDNLLVIGLKNIDFKGYTPIEEITPILRNAAIKDKKAEKIMADISGKTFEELANVANVKSDVVKRISFSAPAYISKTSSSEPVICAAVTKLQEGEVSAPIQGEGGVYVIKLIAKNTKEGEINTKSEEESIVRQAQRNVARFISDLYEKADVTDNRYIFF